MERRAMRDAVHASGVRARLGRLHAVRRGERRICTCRRNRARPALRAEARAARSHRVPRRRTQCTGITHRATFHVAALDERFYALGPASAASVKFIVDVVPDM